MDSGSTSPKTSDRALTENTYRLPADVFEGLEKIASTPDNVWALLRAVPVDRVIFSRFLDTLLPHERALAKRVLSFGNPSLRVHRFHAGVLDTVQEELHRKGFVEGLVAVARRGSVAPGTTLKEEQLVHALRLPIEGAILRFVADGSRRVPLGVYRHKPVRGMRLSLDGRVRTYCQTFIDSIEKIRSGRSRTAMSRVKRTFELTISETLARIPEARLLSPFQK
jgi:hypothetical protein